MRDRRGWKTWAVAFLLLAVLATQLAEPFARRPDEGLPAALEALGHVNHETMTISSIIEREAARQLRVGPDAFRDFKSARDHGLALGPPITIIRTALSDYANVRRSDEGIRDAEELVDRLSEAVIEVYGAQAVRIAAMKDAKPGPVFASGDHAIAYQEATRRFEKAVADSRRAIDEIGEWVAARIPD